MARVQTADPSVFGYSAQQQKAKTSDVNRDIINATKAIQASVANANSNKTVYVASGLALVVIAALAFQNHSQNVKLEKFGDILEEVTKQQGTSFKPPMFDGGPRNEACLDILLPPNARVGKMLYADKYANFWDLVNNSSDEEKVEILSEFRKGAQIKTPNGEFITLPSTSKLGALIATGCDTTLTNFEELYPKLDKKVLFDSLLRSADVANYDQWQKLMDAYQPHMEESKDFPYAYALRYTDVLDAEMTNIKVKVQVGATDEYTVFDSRGKVPIDGYVNPQAVLLKGIFQQRITSEKGYPQFIESQIVDFLKTGDQKRLNKFIQTFPAELEEALFESVLKKLNIQKGENGDYLISDEKSEGLDQKTSPNEAPSTDD